LEDSKTRAHAHLPNITVPALVVNGNADTGVFPSDAQAIFDFLGATDKESHEIDADHYFLTGNARTELADLAAAWIEQRFG
jgi:esterase/lipase